MPLRSAKPKTPQQALTRAKRVLDRIMWVCKNAHAIFREAMGLARGGDHAGDAGESKE